MQSVIGASDEIVTFTENGKKGAYNVTLGKTIVSGADEIMHNNDDETFTANTAEGYKLYAYDGELLATKTEQDDLNNLQLTPNADGYTRVAAQEKESGVPTVNGAVNVNKAISAIDALEIEREDAFLKEYRMRCEEGVNTTTLVFIKGDKETKLTLPAGVSEEGLYYADGKILFTKAEAVPSDAEEGYNVVFDDEGEIEKGNYINYAFDIKSGKMKELQLGYTLNLEEIEPLYDSAAKKYTAFLVLVNEKENGVTHLGNNQFRSFIIDANGKVGVDLSAYGVTYADNIIRLKENRILLAGRNGNFLVDDKGKLVTNLGENVSVGDNLLSVQDGAYNYGAVNFDGEIVLPFTYTSLRVYGSAAYAVANGESAEKIVTAADPAGTTISAKCNFATDETLYSDDYPGLILSVQAFTEDQLEGNIYRLYNLNGAKLCEIKDYGDSWNVGTQIADANSVIVQITHGIENPDQESDIIYDTVTEYYIIK